MNEKNEYIPLSQVSVVEIMFEKSFQYYKFCAYGFLKNLKFYDVFLILFFREAGLSFVQIGFLYSIRQIAINLFEIPSGMIADLFGRRNALLFSFVSYIASFLLFYISDRYLLFLISMFVFGLGEAFRSGTHKAMILSYLEQNDMLQHRTAFYGHTRSWSQFGSAISSLAAMLIVFFEQNYRSVFLYTIIPYVLDALVVATYPDSLNRSSAGEPRHLLFSKITDNFRTVWTKFLRLLRDGAPLRATISAALYIGFFKSTKDYLQPVLKLTALSLPLGLGWAGEQRAAVLIGIVYFAIYLITSATSRHAWRVERKFTDVKKAIDVLYLWGIGGVALSGLFLWLGWQAAAIAVFVLLFVVQNLRRPMIVGYLGEVIDSRILASGLSLESQFQTIIILVFAPVLGFLCDRFGIAGGLLMGSLIFMLVFPIIRIRR